MGRVVALRPACLYLALLWLLAAGTAIASPAGGVDVVQLLRQADAVSPSDHARFGGLMRRLDAMQAQLSPQQQRHWHYLVARKLVFAGNYTAALPSLLALAHQAADPVLAFRANATIIDVLVAQSRYAEAFARLNPLLEQLPSIKLRDARIQGLGVAAQLYDEAGQYDAAARYADQLIKESADSGDTCKGWYYKSEAQIDVDAAPMAADQFREGMQACDKAGDNLFALGFRADQASFYLRQGQPEPALRLLLANYPKVLRAGFPPQVALFEATLAQAYWKQGDTPKATMYAYKALASNAGRPHSSSTAAIYRLLFEIDKHAGDTRGALANLEKFVAVDEDYQNRLSAKALAYRISMQKVLSAKLELAQLDKKNQLLGLQAKLARKTVETTRLYVLLLLLVLAFIGFWAYRLKRSQISFMRLARRDGLTGIFNRQHFVDEAERELAYCRQSLREACLVLIDLDHFKAVNDTHGHAVGDRVLKRAVAACQEHLRSTDIFGRLGGEEFGIMLADCTLAQAVSRIELMREAIASSASGEDGPAVPVSASFGIASTVRSGHELRLLLIDADTALYQAKRKGRNRVNVHGEPPVDQAS